MSAGTIVGMDGAPDEDPAIVRIARWLQASPAELIGLAILVLGAIVASVLLWQQATGRPTALVNEAAAVGEEHRSLAPEGAPGVGAVDNGPIGFAGTGNTDVGGGLHASDSATSALPDGTRDAGAHVGGPPPSNASGPSSDPPSDDPHENTEVVVHVTGAVRDPGVVVLPSGGRVSDAVRAAGGMSDQALPELINLARPVADGEHVHIPVEGEDPPPISPVAPVGEGLPADQGTGPDGSGSQGPIDINRATAAELETLPGIGPARAQAIIEYREANGPFATPGDLRAVSGIGEATFQNIAERVTVG